MISYSDHSLTLLSNCHCIKNDLTKRKCATSALFCTEIMALKNLTRISKQYNSESARKFRRCCNPNIQSTKNQIFTRKRLMEIHMPPDRQRNFSAAILFVEQQEIEYGICSEGCPSAIAVKGLSFLDKPATLPRTGVDRCHHLSSDVFQAFLQIGV